MPLFPNDPPTGWCHGDLDAVLHFDSTKTGVLIRRALREAFPGTRFSVRKSQYPYKWETIMTVRWTDGPSRQQVERITERFVSTRRWRAKVPSPSPFDPEGMIDGPECWSRIYRTFEGFPMLLGTDIVDVHPVVFGPEQIRTERSFTAGLLTAIVSDHPSFKKQWWYVAKGIEGRTGDEVIDDAALPVDVDERYGVTVVRSPTAEAIADIDRETFEAMVAKIRKVRAGRRMGAGHERVNVKTGTDA